ncbi:MAG: hypothetical protein HYX86_01340 [Chloroflexi bacterium]|nr:hypothetical protein [Chloroflexota bacterium]
MEIVESLNAPYEVQDFLRNELRYNFEEEGDTSQAAVELLRSRTAHCFEGATFAAAMLWYHGRPPTLVLLEAPQDYDHNLVIYWENGRVGSVAMSRHQELMGKPALFPSIRDLVLAYYPDYWSDWTEERDELTLRGFSEPIDLRQLGTGWVLGPGSWEVYKNYLKGVRLEMLFPTNEEEKYYLYPEEYSED